MTVSSLTSTPQPFSPVIREHRFSKQTIGTCPSTPPWLTKLVKNGTTLDLNDVIIQAGQHFVDAFVGVPIASSSSIRHEAAALADVLLSLAGPRVSSARRLWLRKPRDSDLQRWTSELLGVGAGIALLDAEGVIDAKTLKKVGKRFDFAASPPGGGARIDLEFKGTVNAASRQNHRDSFRKKLNSKGGLRGYGQAIGVTFLGWTRGNLARRTADFELMDPGEPEEADREEAVRAIIGHYGRRYAEAGMLEVAQGLAELSTEPNLFEESFPMSEWVGRPGDAGRFARARLTIAYQDGKDEYWGAFWEGPFVPHANVQVGRRTPHDYANAFVGISSRVISSLRQRDFGALLRVRDKAGSFSYSDGKREGIMVRRRDGTVFVWTNAPADLSFELQASRARPT